jgi:hypothetical protein
MGPWRDAAAAVATAAAADAATTSVISRRSSLQKKYLDGEKNKNKNKNKKQKQKAEEEESGKKKNQKLVAETVAAQQRRLEAFRRRTATIQDEHSMPASSLVRGPGQEQVEGFAGPGKVGAS